MAPSMLRTLDKLFTDHLLARLEEGKRYRALVKDSFLENNLDYLENMLVVHFIDAAKAAQESTIEFEKKLKDYREEAASLDRTLHYGAAKLPGEKIAEYSEKLAQLHFSIEQLDLKKKRSEIAQQEIQKVIDKMDDIPGAWKGMDSGMQRRFIKMSTESIMLTKPAPNWLLLDVSWLFYDTHSLFFIRQGKAQREAWTEVENSILRRLYPITDRATVLEALPRRNWDAIINQAMRLELTRTYQRSNSTVPRWLSLDDAAFMAHAGLELETADQRVWYKDVVQNNDNCSTTIPIWRLFTFLSVPTSQ